MAVPIPVIINVNRRDNPSSLKSKFIPNEGTQLICCNCTFPLEIKGINDAKNVNSSGGKTKSKGLHFAFSPFPKNTIAIENSNPDNTASSI